MYISEQVNESTQYKTNMYVSEGKLRTPSYFAQMKTRNFWAGFDIGVDFKSMNFQVDENIKSIISFYFNIICIKVYRLKCESLKILSPFNS